MLDKLRKASAGWVAQLFIALLVVSFGVWGVSGFFTGFNSDVIATVGNTEVTVRQFARSYDLALRQLGQQLGQQITPEQAQMFGLPQQVLGRLIADATLTDEARRMGLGISNEALSRKIAEDEAFQDPSGNFDRNLFVQLLQNAGLTEDQYVEELRTGYVRQQIVDGLAGETEVPDAFMRGLHEYRNEERSLAWVVLDPASAGVIPEPTDAELNAYFEAHKSDWRAPEFRAATLMSLTPADLADAAAVSDEDAKQVYDRVVATRFTTPERRQVQQIVFDSAAEAQAAAAALSGGTTFEEILTEHGLTPEAVDLGLIRRDEIIDPKVAEAAFALAPNGISELIEGQFGPVIVRVIRIEPQVVTPFEEVKEQLKTEIAEQRAAEEIADQIDVIEDARAGGATLEEVAGNYGLTLRTIPAIDASGRDADGNAIPDLPGGQALVAALFESDVGLENNPIPVDRGYVWYAVTAVSAPRDRELAEVRDKVIAAWKAAEVEKRLTERAEQIRTQVEAGTDLATAAGPGIEVKTADGVKRGGEPPAGLTDAAVEAAFGGPKGFAAVAEGEGGAKIVVVATAVTVPPYFSGAPDLAEAEEQFSGDLANDLLSQYVYQLQQRLGVAVNQAALQTAIGVSQAGQGL
ncbi:MAG TPA: SurA N-terminal domain-containing protein [Bauldia sp.]|nr:SurA N-terminal domain-containing protein [Bauldia sp.]